MNKKELQIFYGNLIEKSNVKLDNILALNIPSEDKKIAVEIRNDEVKKLRTEFMQKLYELETQGKI